jgi:hypothetical protein
MRSTRYPRCLVGDENYEMSRSELIAHPIPPLLTGDDNVRSAFTWNGVIRDPGDLSGDEKLSNPGNLGNRVLCPYVRRGMKKWDGKRLLNYSHPLACEG